MKQLKLAVLPAKAVAQIHADLAQIAETVVVIAVATVVVAAAAVTVVGATAGRRVCLTSSKTDRLI